MDKINLGNQGFTIPMPQAILGTMLDGKPNFMALGWVTRVNYRPPLLAIGVNKVNESHRAILQTEEFSVSFPSEDMIEATDYVGIVSARKYDKSQVFDVLEGELPNAPIIRECPVSMECRLVERLEFPTNWLFVGEIVATWSEERFLTDGMPDVKKIRPFTLTMPDNRYWAVGEQVGKAWGDGKKLKERLKAEGK